MFFFFSSLIFSSGGLWTPASPLLQEFFKIVMRNYNFNLTFLDYKDDVVLLRVCVGFHFKFLTSSEGHGTSLNTHQLVSAAELDLLFYGEVS